jgi:hypothetical protein
MPELRSRAKGGSRWAVLSAMLFHDDDDPLPAVPDEAEARLIAQLGGFEPSTTPSASPRAADG